jgi:hypothetical protein
MADGTECRSPVQRRHAIAALVIVAVGVFALMNLSGVVAPPTGVGHAANPRQPTRAADASGGRYLHRGCGPAVDRAWHGGGLNDGCRSESLITQYANRESLILRILNR